MTTPKRKPTHIAIARTLARTAHAAPADTAADFRPITADQVLRQAAATIAERGRQRDSGQGQERSMVATVAAFNAIEGTQLTERQGWAFMQILKMTRAATTARNGLHNPDDALDGAAYSALGGEAAAAAFAANAQREAGAS